MSWGWGWAALNRDADDLVEDLNAAVADEAGTARDLGESEAF